ncbi:uncharacterized protein [Periplaneta americana]|uniref:uncharacterized protein n=1 Tax=Periplaneta americana TaxID=6978 RepID=UPI0037E8F3C2
MSAPWRISCTVLLAALSVVANDDKINDVSPQDPPSDVAQDRRPSVRTNMTPHQTSSYDGPPVHHHDLKTSGSSDYAYTYPGVSSSSPYEHFSGGAYDHGVHHEHFHVVEDHGHHDHDHDHHHHHDDDDDYGIKPRDVAFGFLTFMIILSSLQGALINLSKNNNLVGVITSRRRRDVSQLYSMNEVPDVPLPFPTKLDEKNWLLVEDKQVRCMQHSVCATNRQLAHDLGSTGRVLGRYLTRLVAKSVDTGWARLVADAGKAGLAGVDCAVLYRGCHGHLDPAPATKPNN